MCACSAPARTPRWPGVGVRRRHRFTTISQGDTALLGHGGWVAFWRCVETCEHALHFEGLAGNPTLLGATVDRAWALFVSFARRCAEIRREGVGGATRCGRAKLVR